jgi:hypothetical protein
LVLVSSEVDEPSIKEHTDDSKHQREESDDPLMELILEGQHRGEDRAFGFCSSRCYCYVGAQMNKESEFT